MTTQPLRRPQIAIVGSVDPARANELDLRDTGNAPEACAALGRELATHGLNIVVYSSARTFVESEVVRGYVASGAALPKSIQVRTPHGDKTAEFPETGDHRELFDYLPFSSEDWDQRLKAKEAAQQRDSRKDSRRAIVRHSFDKGREWFRTAILGMAVGGAAGLLFIAAQLLTSPDVLNTSDARRLLWFVVPVGFIAGLTFDTVYRKLRAQDVTRGDVLNQL